LVMVLTRGQETDEVSNAGSLVTNPRALSSCARINITDAYATSTYTSKSYSVVKKISKHITLLA